MSTAADSEGSKVSMSLGADGLSVSGSGHIGQSIGHSIVDALSPFTSALGWVGDHLTIKRRQAVLRAAQKANEQLRSEGISTGNIPPKILLPWVDGASRETDEDPTLVDMWAGLFARAVKSSDAVNISYIDALKRIGADEAQLLDWFATDRAPSYTQSFYWKIGDPWSQENSLFYDQAEIFLENRDIWGFKEWIEGAGLQSMRQVMFVRDDIGNAYPSEYFNRYEHAIANMEHLGLVSIKERSFEYEGYSIDVIWFEISKFGFDLVWACKGILTGTANKNRSGS